MIISKDGNSAVLKKPSHKVWKQFTHISWCVNSVGNLSSFYGSEGQVIIVNFN